MKEKREVNEERVVKRKAFGELKGICIPVCGNALAVQ
jgi:hypothetical protein